MFTTGNARSGMCGTVPGVLPVAAIVVHSSWVATGGVCEWCVIGHSPWVATGGVCGVV